MMRSHPVAIRPFICQREDSLRQSRGLRRGGGLRTTGKGGVNWRHLIKNSVSTTIVYAERPKRRDARPLFTNPLISKMVIKKSIVEMKK